MKQLAPLPSPTLPVPLLVAAAGDRASTRFLEFFAANIRNPHTRRAYSRAVAEFLAWCELADVSSIAHVAPLHVATWIEAQVQAGLAAPSVKQRLAALRHLFDWLVVGQIMPTNPAASVRGPQHVVKGGKTRVLDPAEARTLLDSIDTSTQAGLRNRALIALMVYSFARVPERVAFPALDKTISDFPQKRKFLRDVEAELQAIDAAAWVALKAKPTPLPKRDNKRDLQPLYDTLNEAKAYDHLARIGCANVHFIPLSTIERQKTPDLGATDADGRKVLCDANTINISDREVARRRSGGAAMSTDQLDSGFLRKLKCDLEHAKAQMVAYGQDGAARKIAYVVANYDDSLHEYGDLYRLQIAQFMTDNAIPELEVEFDIKPPFYSAQS